MSSSTNRQCRKERIVHFSLIHFGHGITKLDRSPPTLPILLNKTFDSDKLRKTLEPNYSQLKNKTYPYRSFQQLVRAVDVL